MKRLASFWISGVVLASCQTPPKQVLCIMGPDGTCDGQNQITGKPISIEWDRMNVENGREAWTCRPASTEQSLIEWAKRNCKGPK